MRRLFESGRRGRVLLSPPPEHEAGSRRQLTQDEILQRIRSAGVAAAGFASGAEVLADLESSLAGDEVVL